MSWAGSSRLDLYLGVRRVGLCRGDELLAVRASEDFAGALSAGSEALRTHGQKDPVRIWLSGALCRPFIVPAGLGAKGANELLAAAKAMVPAKLGWADDCELRLEAGKREESRLAIAVPRSTLDTINQNIRPITRIASIRPWWASVLEGQLAGDETPTALGIHDGDALTVLAGSGDGFSLALTYAPIADEVSARAAWSRSILNDAVPDGPNALIRLFDGPALRPLERTALGAMAEVVT